MGRTLRFLGLGLLCLTPLSTTAAGLPRPAVDFPLPVDGYHDQQIPSLLGKLMGRIQREPLNLVATIIFFGAIVHTFLAGWFRKIAHRYQQGYDEIEYLLEAKDGPPDFGKKHDKLLFRAQLFYFTGEVEAGPLIGSWTPGIWRSAGPDVAFPEEDHFLVITAKRPLPHSLGSKCDNATK